MKRKVKRYEEGGKTEADYKREGLAASNRDLDEERSKMSGLEKFTSGFKRLGRRLTEGNIDQPGSEAYYKYGAGRGKMIEESTKPVPEMSSDYSGRGATTLSDAKPKEASSTMDLTDRLRAASPGSNIPRMDGEGGGYTSPVKEEVKKESKAKPKKSKLQVQNEMAKRMAKGYAKAAGSEATRSTGSGSVNEDLMYPTKRGSGGYGYGFKKGGKVSSASSRADGIAQRGKTKGRIC
jgi:hypothetical protein